MAPRPTALRPSSLYCTSDMFLEQFAYAKDSYEIPARRYCSLFQWALSSWNLVLPNTFHWHYDCFPVFFTFRQNLHVAATYLGRLSMKSSHLSHDMTTRKRDAYVVFREKTKGKIEENIKALRLNICGTT